jgi:ABC-type lipoprotein export system ATPase subunit
MTDAVVRGDGLARTYGRGRAAVVALYGVSFELFGGDRVAVVGPSGSGKSTLLHLMAGLDVPTAGSIAWPALEPHGPRAPGATGFVFQGPSLLPDLDVLENTALPLLLAERDAASARRSATAVLARLGLEELSSRVPAELSGGQAQRVAVARALVGGPRLVLADEPTGQLDHESAALVVAALLDAARDGALLVVATHDPAVAELLERQWTMADGHMLAEERSCSA